MVMFLLRGSFPYQLALITPGISPGQRQLAETDPAQVELAKVAARPAAAETAVAVPDLHPRRDVLVGCHLARVFSSFAIFAVVAMRLSVFLVLSSGYCRNGIPMCFSSARPSASVLAVVVIEIFMPLTFSTLL